MQSGKLILRILKLNKRLEEEVEELYTKVVGGNHQVNLSYKLLKKTNRFPLVAVKQFQDNKESSLKDCMLEAEVLM